MKKRYFIPVIIAALASLFASQKPDGLDRVSETLGFSHRAVSHAAVLSGYRISFLGNSKLSAVFAGIAGVLIVYGLFWSCIKLQYLFPVPTENK